MRWKKAKREEGKEECVYVCVCCFLRVTIVNTTNPPARIMASNLTIQNYTTLLLTPLIRHKYTSAHSSPYVLF